MAVRFRSHSDIAVIHALAVLLFAASTTVADITYTLHLGSSTEENQVAASVAEGAAIYNTYGSFNKHWDVYYNAGIPTAEANYTGYMGYGSQRTTRTVLHEGAHTLGMGTYPGDTGPVYSSMVVGGVWQGQYGNQAQFDTYNDYGDGLHGDTHHAIWPGGMNQESEDGYIERIWTVRIQAAIRCDMGIMAFSREAENELVHAGETAEFRVDSPIATSYQWYKDGAPLVNGGDISGADTDTLRVANAEAADEGSYHCAATGANESLLSRARQLFVDPVAQLGQWDMEGNVNDSVSTNHGTAFGGPGYDVGKYGQAISLDGIDDYVDLPDAVVYARDFTIATWVKWDGGGDWQRIFDFGNDIYQNIFLTPRSGSGTMRLVFKDAVNGVSSEQILETTALPSAVWVHVAAVLNGDYATLYVNGEAVGSIAVPVTDLVDFLPTENYIGKSQWPDPTFDGRIDDFRIYNYAFDGSDVWNLWGQSANAAPVFDTNTVLFPAICAGYEYAAPSLQDYVYDADDTSLTFSMIDGPAWLSVAADGTLSGIPQPDDAGGNILHVRVEDPSGASSDMEVQIQVMVDFTQGPIAYWDFDDGALGAANGVALPDSDGYTIWREAATDKSGNGNHLTTWDYAYAGFHWSTLSDQGDFSIAAADLYPAAYTWSAESAPAGIDVETVVLSNFTVEALATTSGSGFRTVVGRDARHVSTSDHSLAAFYLGLNPDHHPVARMTDQMGTTVELVATGVTVPNDDATWYHLAAVKQGDSFRLYVNGTEEDSDTVAGLGALVRGGFQTLGWHRGGWSVGRGLYGNTEHTDRWYGHIDAVAISGVALSPGAFVIGGTWPSGYEFYVEEYGIPGAPFEGDWNSNGIPNGMEYFLGSDPADMDPPGSFYSLATDYNSVSYPYNRYATGVSNAIEWTTDLMASNWTDVGVSYVTNDYPADIEATFATSVSNQMFLRLRVDE